MRKRRFCNKFAILCLVSVTLLGTLIWMPTEQRTTRDDPFTLPHNIESEPILSDAVYRTTPVVSNDVPTYRVQPAPRREAPSVSPFGPRLIPIQESRPPVPYESYPSRRHPDVTCNHWSGESAYRPVQKGESWTWLMVFLNSIPNKLDNSEAAANYISQKLDHRRRHRTRSAKDGDSVLSFRFENTSVPSIEKRFLAANDAVEHRIIHVPRFECVTGYCRHRDPGEKPQVRGSIQIPRDAEVVFINFLYADTYDVDRILPYVTSATVLVTTFWTEPSSHSADWDYPLLLYDLFHKMYFQYNWMPKRTTFMKCMLSRYGCKAWIVWVKWSYAKHSTYLPPAGDGSDYREMARLRYFYANPCDGLCKLRQMFGGNDTVHGYSDGGYTICLDLLPASPTPENCMVYSFGICDEWSFDDAMHSMGCSVYSFDPSMNRTAHQRGAHHWFYPWGLGELDSREQWTLMHFHEIRELLGHTDKVITVLKLDIEGGEWDLLEAPSLEKQLSTVMQFVGEIHPNEKMVTNPLEQTRALHDVEKLGFAMFATRRNPGFRDVRIGAVPEKNEYLYEPSYVNLRYLQKRREL